MIGLSIKKTIGIGDALQFSSLPENYFRATGKKLVDVCGHWFFDHNPFVIRDDSIKLDKVVEMWNFSPTQYQWPNPRKDGKPKVYLSNAEVWASLFEVPCVLNRPRLYRFEEYPFHNRQIILLHTSGVSHGEMPAYIIDHVIKKYGATNNLYHIGPPNSKDYGIPKIMTATLWDLAEVISKSRMLIGVDSSPSWVAACYPDVIVKKVRTKPIPPEQFENWVPLDMGNIHSFWDDRCHQIYNISEKDIGFTYSYKRI